MRFVLASGNEGKLRELRDILTDLGVEVVSKSELGISLDVEENGTTFSENAIIKASAFCEKTGLPAIADDSGLMVDALDGAPGVYSARYGSVNGEKLSDSERNALLLKNTEDKTDRGAKFVSSVACVFPDGTVITAEGECCGELLREPRGNNGFGYDPLFYIPELDATMAEIPEDIKNRISHRGNALRLFAEKLKIILESR